MSTKAKKTAINGAKTQKKLTQKEKKQVEALNFLQKNISKLYVEGKINVFNPAM